MDQHTENMPLYLALTLAVVLVSITALLAVRNFRHRGRLIADSELRSRIMADRQNEKFLNELSSRNPHSAEPSMALIQLHLYERRWEDAVDESENLKAKFSKLPDAWSLQATALRHAGRNEDAERVLSTAVRKFPSQAKVRADYALMLNSRRAYDLALVEWTRLLKKNPDFAEGYSGATETLINLGRLSEASALIQRAKMRFPTNSSVFVQWASLANASEDWGEAERRWRVVVECHPGIPHGYCNLSETLCRLGRLHDAFELIEGALGAFPKSPSVALQYKRVTNCLRSSADKNE